MISLIIPAHNEQFVIARSLRALMDGAEPGELEIVVVCNGCTDRTAESARAMGEMVRVIETDVASKSNALNLGDEAASGFPRFYLDADVVLSLESVRTIASAMARSGALAAAPAVETRFLPGTSWMVRGYYRLWTALPYVQEGMIGSGVYAISREGRCRFGRFPGVIADDGFVRLAFSAQQRIKVSDAVCAVWAPKRLWQLIRIKTRSRLGFYQLQSTVPAMFQREAQTKRYARASTVILRQPRLWPYVFAYLFVNLVSRWRARRQLGGLNTYTWERDNSTRGAQEAVCQ